MANPTSFGQGLCMKTCDPFANECGAELACRYSVNAWTDGTTLSTCLWTGTKAEGAACNYASGDDCEGGLSCIVATTDGSIACRAPCDDAHPCPDGRTCLPDRNQGEDSAFGFCMP